MNIRLAQTSTLSEGQSGMMITYVQRTWNLAGRRGRENLVRHNINPSEHRGTRFFQGWKLYTRPLHKVFCSCMHACPQCLMWLKISQARNRLITCVENLGWSPQIRQYVTSSWTTVYVSTDVRSEVAKVKGRKWPAISCFSPMSVILCKQIVEIKLTSSLPSVRHVFIASAQLAAMSRRKGKKSIKISSKTNISFEIE